jgi:predicted Zn-dependent protease
MLEEMDRNLKPGGMGFAKTHPKPKDRIDELSKILRSADHPATLSKDRAERFEKFAKKI